MNLKSKPGIVASKNWTEGAAECGWNGKSVSDKALTKLQQGGIGRASKLIPRRMTMMRARQGRAGQGRHTQPSSDAWQLGCTLPPLLSPNVTLTPHCSTLTWLHLTHLFCVFAVLHISCSSWLLHLLISFSQMLFSHSHLWQSDVRHKALHLVWHENNKKESVFWKKRRGLLKGRLVGLGVSCWQLLKRIRATVQLSLGTSQPAIGCTLTGFFQNNWAHCCQIVCNGWKKKLLADWHALCWLEEWWEFGQQVKGGSKWFLNHWPS